MATSEIQQKPDARAAFAITLDSLAAAAGRQSDMLTNTNRRPSALVALALESGTAPSLGGTYDVYLLRSDGVIADDGAGASDAAIAVVNAEPLGSIVVTASGNTTFKKVFDTTPLGPLGPNWAIAVVNRTDQALHAAGGSNAASYTYLIPESQ